ncbi:MAG: SCO family protein [Candidatus Entotheonellia bacterium]
MFASVMPRLTFIFIVLMLLGGSSPGLAGEQPHVFHGIVSQSPPRAADFALTAHTGKPVRLGDFQGKLVLLYFGYTFCPGICPTTLAEVAQAMQTLGPKAAERMQVLMISVDPERDTPERLAAYLPSFNPTFLGLTGTPDEIAATAASYGIYAKKYEGSTADSSLVDHTSMVIVVDDKGFVRLLFPFGTPAQTMADDLAALLHDAASASGGPQIQVENAWGRPLPEVVTANDFYMVIRNRGSAPDKLVGGSSPACGMVGLYDGYTTPQGAMGMRPVPGGFIEVPPTGMVELKAGGLHIMCMHKKQDFTSGIHLPLTLEFERSGEITVQVSIRQQ